MSCKEILKQKLVSLLTGEKEKLKSLQVLKQSSEHVSVSPCEEKRILRCPEKVLLANPSRTVSDGRRSIKEHLYSSYQAVL